MWDGSMLWNYSQRAQGKICSFFFFLFKVRAIYEHVNMPKRISQQRD